MDSGLKFDHKQQMDGGKREFDERIPYGPCFTDRVKNTDTLPVEVKRTSTSGFYNPERSQSRKVLPLTRLNSVDAIQTNTFHGDYSSMRLTKRISSVERPTMPPSLHLPYLLVNKDAHITPVFNMATYKGFRTQEERKSLSWSRQLERDHKHLFHDGKLEEKCFAVPTVIDISKPAKLNAR